MCNLNSMRYILIVLIFLCFGFFPLTVEADELVKVKLVKDIGNTTEVTFSLHGEYLTLDPTLNLKEGVTYKLSLKGGKFFLSDGKNISEINGSVMLIPALYSKENYMKVNNKPYLGLIEFTKESTHIRPINQLPLEDYLKGVVPFEVFPTWKLETLKAQALAARTYAYTHLHDVMDDTIQFQVYGGYTWDPNTTKAVEETAGEIITNDQQPIAAFYSASNGGITESNANVWGGEPIPYYPIQKDPYDPIHPWEFSFNQDQIDLEKINWDNPNWWDETFEEDEKVTLQMKKYLERNGYLGDIKILSIPKFKLIPVQTESCRSIKGSIEIVFLHRLFDGTVVVEKQSMIDEKLNKIRPMIGGDIFRSYLLDSLELKDKVYTLKGRGYGHGVGMSQWGASVMGDKGKTYKEILEFYFPNTKILKIKDLKKIDKP